MVGGWKVIASRHRRPISPLADRRFGTFETYRRILRMSANRGRLEVADNRQNDANDPDRTLRAPRRELWYPPSNAMGRFNAYKARHLIENFFCKLKQYRAIATRYDKTARNFIAAIHLAAAIIWLN